MLLTTNAMKIKTNNAYKTDMTKYNKLMLDNSFVLLPSCVTMIEIAPAGGCNTPQYAMKVTVKEHANDVCNNQQQVIKRKTIKNRVMLTDVYENPTYTYLPVTTLDHQFSLRR